MRAKRFIIIPVKVNSPGQVIQIDKKIPANLLRCNGIFVTVKGFLNTAGEIQRMGEVSLLFNSGKTHPYHHTVGYKKTALDTRKLFSELSEDLIPNYRVRGFYSDYGTSHNNIGVFLPYSVNIYLECKAKI